MEFWRCRRSVYGIVQKIVKTFHVLEGLGGKWNILITSTSAFSRSDNVPEALRVGGGASIAAIFFLFFDAKKLPKKPPLVSDMESRDGLAARGTADGGKGFPVLGSTWVGLLAAFRSLTMAIA